MGHLYPGKVTSVIKKDKVNLCLLEFLLFREYGRMWSESIVNKEDFLTDSVLISD